MLAWRRSEWAHVAHVALTLSETLPGSLLPPLAKLLFRGGLESRLEGLFLGGIVDAGCDGPVGTPAKLPLLLEGDC
jgi:hypothetical protein